MDINKQATFTTNEIANAQWKLYIFQSAGKITTLPFHLKPVWSHLNAGVISLKQKEMDEKS